MHGKITSWKDDKGFGFISTDGESEQIFFHISSVKKATRKPEVGDKVVFDVAKDSQGRLKATHVLLEGVLLAKPIASKKIITEPVKKDAIDYGIYFVLALLIVILLSLFIKTGVSESALVPGAIFLIASIFLSRRKKQPVNKSFSCSKCSLISSHDERTVLAWNRGFNRLYCKSCHQAWLSEQPKEHRESQTSYASSKSGCLGLILIISFTPLLLVVVAITWIV